MQLFFCSICKIDKWGCLQRICSLRRGILDCRESKAWRDIFFCLAAEVKPPRGRPKATEGEPPMPKTWKDTETLAGVLAWIEKSEDGADAALEEHAQQAYSAQLDYVHSSVKEFEPSLHRWGKTNYISPWRSPKRERRPYHTKGQRWFENEPRGHS